MRGIVIIGSKEFIDHIRDYRSLLSTSVYALMGPAVVFLLQSASSGAMSDPQRNAMMISVFTLLSAFSGATAIAADTIAGERERRSLVPLLLSGVTPEAMVAGKWLAASGFAFVSCMVTLLAFIGVSQYSVSMPAISAAVLIAIPNLICLAVLAAALQVLISTSCRSVKEANSYLTMLVFAAMGLSMWAVFARVGDGLPWSIVPVLGDRHLLQSVLCGSSIQLLDAAVAGLISLSLSAVVIVLTGRLFRSDKIVFGT